MDVVVLEFSLNYLESHHAKVLSYMWQFTRS